MRVHRTVIRSSSPRLALAFIALMIGLVACVLLPASAASADVDDFDYSSWQSRYEISLDDEGRAVAHVTETLVAEFPDFDQNKGIIRGYVERYKGAGVSQEILSVKDADGDPVPFWTESEDGTLLVLTGNDDYVRGAQTYVIESEMRDVVAFAADTDSDEFYWNLLPLNSTQDIARFHAEIALAPELTDALTGSTACYIGAYGHTDKCTLAGPEQADGGTVFSVEAEKLTPGEGVTVAIGFTPGVVVQPISRSSDPVTDWGGPALGLASLLTSVGSWFALSATRRRKRKGTGIVVAQFDVPADMPPLVAAPLVPRSPDPIPAQIIHLAVNGALRVEEVAKGSRPVVRVVDPAAAQHPLDQATMKAIFTGTSTERKIPKSSTKFAKRMTKLTKAGEREAQQRGWLTKQRSRFAMAVALLALVLFIGSVVFLIRAAIQDRDSATLGMVAVMLSFMALLSTAFAAFAKWTMHTPAGAERSEYLLGVREFIRVAEADRLRMLQSYTGADRRSDGTIDVIHLYEKLLPYAMLFNEEKSWTKVLQTPYAESTGTPGWIAASSIGSLHSQVSRFSSATASASSFSPSSSSGGSTGGGFSGGGGGGGFSGGR